MEEYLFVDNRPSHPLDFFLRLHFEGPLDSDQVIAAFRDTLQLHPLLDATIQQNRGRPFWQRRAELPLVQVQSNTTSKAACDSSIDITLEAGCRLSILAQQNKATLQFQFHHAATDALGGLEFIGDVLRNLARANSIDVPQPERDVQELRNRHHCGYPDASLWEKIRKQAHAIYLTREFLGCRVSPVVSHQPNLDQPRLDEDALRDIQHRLTVEETFHLQQAAGKSGVSVNTLMLRDAFVSLDEVRRDQADYCCDDFIRIAIPGNMRVRETSHKIPAANFFSMTFPAANGLQSQDASALLNRIQQEISNARTEYYFATFLFGLKVARKIPGGLKRILKPDKCQASLLLTNVGHVFHDTPILNAEGFVEVAGCRLETIDFVAPMRPHQSISLALHQYAGRQSINLSYDPRVHNDAQAHVMLDAYVKQLQQSIQPVDC